MTLPTAKWAVYYGTIKLKDGSMATYSAADIAELYGITGESYLAIALTDPEPFINGPDYMSYYHLKPLPDGNYFDAIQRYNTNYEEQWDEDFVTGKGKWAVRPDVQSDEDF